MLTKSMWWCFLLLFGLTIGGVQSLGSWVRPLGARTQVTQTDADHNAVDAAHRHVQSQPLHWRSMLMHQ